MPQWSRISALVMTVSTAPSARVRLALAHAVADHLAAAELHLLAVDREVLLDLDEEVGVGEPDPVAGGRAEHVGIGARGMMRSSASSSVPIDLAAEAVARSRAPANGDELHLAASARARSARRCRRRCRAACRAPRRGRSAAPGWSRRSGSGSRPGSAGRRCWRPSSGDAVAAVVELDRRPSAARISPGIIARSPLSGSAGGR